MVQTSTMVTTVRRDRQKRSIGRGAGGRSRGNAGSLAVRTAETLKQVRKLINVETKNLSTTITSTTVDMAGTVTPLTLIPQGSDQVQRIGDSVHLSSVFVGAYVTMHASAAHTCVRFILVRDLENQGVAPSIGSIILSNGTAEHVVAPYVHKLRERWGVLGDDIFAMSSGESTVLLKWNIAHRGQVRFLTTGSDQASQGAGSVYLVMVSNEPTNMPTVKGIAEVLYTDS
jgi:hypothetical protein